MNAQVFVDQEYHYMGHLHVVEKKIFRSPEHETLYRHVHWSDWAKPRSLKKTKKKWNCRVRLKEVRLPSVSLCFIPKSNYIDSPVPISFVTLKALDDFLSLRMWRRVDFDTYRSRSGHTPLV